MKTLSEFNGFLLKAVAATHAELVQAGKTAEELLAGIGEKHKAEGDKLKWLHQAFDSAKDQLEKLKRVLVLQPAEGEKAPKGAREWEGLFFLLEFFPEAPRPAAREERSDRRGKGGKGDRKKGGKRDGKPGRGPRRDRPTGEAVAASGSPAADDARAPRSERKPRPPRREPLPEEPPKPFVRSTNEPLLKPRSMTPPPSTQQALEAEQKA